MLNILMWFMEYKSYLMVLWIQKDARFDVFTMDFLQTKGLWNVTPSFLEHHLWAWPSTHVAAWWLERPTITAHEEHGVAPHLTTGYVCVENIPAESIDMKGQREFNFEITWLKSIRFQCIGITQIPDYTVNNDILYVRYRNIGICNPSNVNVRELFSVACFVYK